MWCLVRGNFLSGQVSTLSHLWLTNQSCYWSSIREEDSWKLRILQLMGRRKGKWVPTAPGHFWQQHDYSGCSGSLRHHQEEPTQSPWFSDHSGQWHSGGILLIKRAVLLLSDHTLPPCFLLSFLWNSTDIFYVVLYWGKEVLGPLVAFLNTLRDRKAYGKVSSEICQVTSEELKSNSPLVVYFFLHLGLGLLANLQAAWGWCGSRSFTIWVPICFSTSEKKEAQGVLSGTDWASENQTMSLAWLLIRSKETHCIELISILIPWDKIYKGPSLWILPGLLNI